MDIEKDKEITIQNRYLLLKNKNLLYWYQKLFQRQMERIDPEQDKILEIGSGTSPIKLFYPKVNTSDVLELDYVDYIFDCHCIESVNEIADASLDFIIMTNVLHHLENPLYFLSKVSLKLRQGAVVFITEPFFSTLSTIIYKYFHHESVDFAITKPRLENITGPLSSSNIALPHLIFFQNSEWLEEIHGIYDFKPCSYYTSLSYFATGGISKCIPVPHKVFQQLFLLDQLIAEKMPRFFASFFTIQLTKK